MKAKAQGILRHRFWGTYSAAIALIFKSADHASDAKRTLGGDWSVHPDHPDTLIWSGEKEALTKTEAELVSYGADPKKISSLAKSVDHGEPFECEIPIEPKGQGSLF